MKQGSRCPTRNSQPYGLRKPPSMESGITPSVHNCNRSTNFCPDPTKSAVGREKEAPRVSGKPQKPQPCDPQRPADKVEVRGRILGPDGKARSGARLLLVWA